MVVGRHDRYFYYSSSCTKVDRSQTPCYWENQPVGCTKPHCVFKHFKPSCVFRHFKPRPFSSDQPQTGTAGNRSTETTCSRKTGQQKTMSSNHSFPVKAVPRNTAAKLSSVVGARLEHTSPPQKSSPPPRSEDSPRCGRFSSSNVRSLSPPPGKPPSTVSLMSMKSDKPAVQVMSLEEILRLRALDSMMRSREPQADSRWGVEEQEQEEPQPPAKKSLSARGHDRPRAYVSPKKTPLKTRKRQPASLILHKKVSDSDVERYCSTPFRGRQLSASLESDIHNKEEMVVTPLRRRKPVSAADLDKFSHKRVTSPLTLRKRKPVPAANMDEFSHERVTSPLTLRKRRLTPITSPEVFSDKEAVTVHPRKRSIPTAYFEDEPVITPPRKSHPHKRTLDPITNFDDWGDGATAVVSVKKRKLVAAVDQVEDASDEDHPVWPPVKTLMSDHVLLKPAVKKPRRKVTIDTDLFNDQVAEAGKATAKEPRVLSSEEIRRLKWLKRQQEQHEDTATKRVARVPARRSKAEVQIYVSPPRKNAGVSSVKTANMSPPREPSVVRKRLGEPSAGGMKTFSQIMAEKRKKRQLGRQQQRKTSSQQNKVSSQQENNGSGEKASKKPLSSVTVSQDSDQSRQPAHVSSQRQPAHESVTSSALSSSVHQQSMSCGKAATTESRRVSSDLSASCPPSQTKDDLLRKEFDEFIFDDVDFMDLDCLLE